MSVELIQHLINDSSSRAGCVIACQCCGLSFQRGEWCFYSLCGSCFGEYKNQQYGLYRYSGGTFFFAASEWSAYKAEHRDEVPVLVHQ